MVSNIIFYSTPKGNVNIQVIFEEDSFWLTQKAMAELFARSKTTINEHLKNIFETNELEEIVVVRKFRTTATDGKEYQTNFYDLKVVLAVGYRVNSSEATQFRIWTTNTLQEYIVKGFVLDDERLKQGKKLGKDYFDELLERIREIRASERRFYQKITDIYALSIDYIKSSKQTHQFFAQVQNKLHWAITGKTAAETIYTEADATKLNMGLQTWKYAPDGKILKSDVSIAKNYLHEAHISELNRIVSAYLDLAENNAIRKKALTMKEWATFLDNFLNLSSYPILIDNEKITMLEAKLKAEAEFDNFRTIQDKNYESDFDKLIKLLPRK
ncbi:MAG: virulence RhuM family protein [Bacteroidetes bacterium]|nr:virulence RhuM family protein [Bacteroidota bacterium]MBU1484773.1 virulence RhuM family protein [Bacteroidota bacterium]MBU2046679.1 virulence RhuM family protein [Bacteroidota bacterium]MBU2268397.1 virulence RhuM family protein [Bacteroidota bacterium]MBU2376135.1 virulence RhuM family protein [Bacteroidota bacterium]